MSQPETMFARWLQEEQPEEEAGPRPFWKRRSVLIALVALVLVATLGGGWFIHGLLTKSTPPQYQYANVTKGNLALTVSATGPIASQATYNLNFPSSGKVTEVDVQVGQQVQAGQVLAKIDPTSLQDTVSADQAALNADWVTYDDDVQSLSDTKEQNDPCPATKTQDQCTQAIHQAQQKVNSDWAQIQTAQANLKTVQDELQQTTMTAPAAGTVVSINGGVGSTAGAGSGSASGSAFIVLEDLSQLAITAQVGESDIATVQVGQAVRFTVAAYPDKTFRGSVVAISPTGQTSSSVVTYPVTVNVDAHSLGSAHLLPEMTADLQITTQERIGVLLVSNKAISFAQSLLASGQLNRQQVQAELSQALKHTGAQAQQGTMAFVAERHQGGFTPKVIVTGLTDGISTEVLSGLQDGEQVAIGQVGGTSSTPGNSNNGLPAPGSGGGNILGG